MNQINHPHPYAPVRQQMRGVSSLIITIQNIMIFYVCLWATSPILGYGLVFRVLAVIAVAIWAVLEMARPQGIFGRMTAPVLFVAVYIVYNITVESVLVGTDGLTVYLQVWIMLFLLVVYESRRYNPATLAPVFWGMLATMPIWIIATYSSLSDGGEFNARRLSRSSDFAREISEQGVGGFGLIYSIVLLLPILLVMLVRLRRFDFRSAPTLLRAIPYGVVGLIAINFVTATILILKAGYSFAVVISLSAVAAAFFIKKRSAALIVIIPVIGVFLLYFGEGIMLTILEILAPIVEGTPYARKVADIVDSLNAQSAVGTAGIRMERYVRSLTLFMENPIFGVFSREQIGKHSPFLDTLAQYGIVIGGIFIYLMLYLPVRMMKLLRNDFSLPFAVFVVVCLQAMTNSVFAAFGVMLFIMFPAACGMLREPTSRKTHRR